MRLSRPIIATVAATVALVAVPASVPTQAAAAAPCTDGSRSCVIATANTYLDALLSNDGSKVRLAPSARRTENGMDTGGNAKEIRSALSSPTPNEVNTGIREKRWFVSGKSATVIYLLDTSTLPRSAVHTTTVRIVERFRVHRGLITEIEAVFWIAPGPREEGSGWPAPPNESHSSLPAVSPAPAADGKVLCRRSSDRCAIRAAKSYLVALPTRDYRKTQLHPHVRRTQNGDTTAVDADGVRRNGQDPHPDAVISGVRDMRWFVTGHGRSRQVISFSLADTSTMPKTPAHTGTIHLANRFKVVKGLIVQIESIYWIAPGPTPEPSGWE